MISYVDMNILTPACKPRIVDDIVVGQAGTLWTASCAL